VCCRPAGRQAFFVLLPLAFGSIIIFANPPLRGPDEIAHFLRIYSYSRGELLPVTENNTRKGIFVNPELHNQLSFFKTAGEVFARSREEGIRYGQIIAHYSKIADDDCRSGTASTLVVPQSPTNRSGYTAVPEDWIAPGEARCSRDT
jgi:hypothetical protein